MGFVAEEIDLTVEYAEQEFSLGSEQDPNSKRSQLLNAQRQLNKPIPELSNLIELPQSCVHIWQWFLELNNTRQQGFSSKLPITFTEIKSYFDLMQIKPLDWEIGLIKRLDVAYLNADNKNKK